MLSGREGDEEHSASSTSGVRKILDAIDKVLSLDGIFELVQLWKATALKQRP